jgi:carbon storage regulator
MLVLSRDLHEKIWIGDDICIEIVRIDATKVRVGIIAPKHVPIRRSELPPDIKFKAVEQHLKDNNGQERLPQL